MIQIVMLVILEAESKKYATILILLVLYIDSLVLGTLTKIKFLADETRSHLLRFSSQSV
jgi:hypothetical protein